MGEKRLVLVAAQVSTACEDTSQIGSPETVPGRKRQWSRMKAMIAFSKMANDGGKEWRGRHSDGEGLQLSNCQSGNRRCRDRKSSARRDTQDGYVAADGVLPRARVSLPERL